MSDRQFRRLLRLPGLALAVLVSFLFGALARAGWEDWALKTWARIAGRCVGLRIRRCGADPDPGTLLAVNHVGYLDILALGAACPGRFLAKSEIAAWGFFGTIARWGGTLFVDRDNPRSSLRTVEVVAGKLRAGERIVLFPEARVSPDGKTLGTFHPMLFEACIRAGRSAVPVAIRYVHPPERRLWAWIEEPSLWRHLWSWVLPCDEVRAEVHFGTPIAPPASGGRKEMARRVREGVAELLAEEAQSPPREGPGEA